MTRYPFSLRTILRSACLILFYRQFLATSMDSQNSQTKLALSNNQFTFDTLRQVATSSTKGLKNGVNIILSPFNVAQVLSMIMIGAKGETFRQLSDTLHYSSNFQPIPTPQNQEGLHKAIANAAKLHLGAKNRKRNFTLETGYGIYPDKTFLLNPIFEKNVKRFYRATIRNLNFKSQPKLAEKIINQDVSNATNGKIKNLLPPNSLDAFTRMVLIGTIYFKGNWKDKFDPKLTRKIEFKSDDGLSQEVDMMQGSKDGHYGDFDFSTLMDSSIKHPQPVKVLRLDYVDSNLAMFFVLPKQNGLDGLIQDLNTAILTKLIEGLRHEKKIRVTIPKFKIDYGIEMKEVLQKLGMTDIFGNKADLSGISRAESGSSETERLYLSEVYHKAFIEVNEIGSEAAAATGAVISLLSVMTPTEFKADRPFLYFIMDLSNSNILFIGTYSKPPQTNA